MINIYTYIINIYFFCPAVLIDRIELAHIAVKDLASNTIIPEDDDVMKELQKISVVSTTSRTNKILLDPTIISNKDFVFKDEASNWIVPEDMEKMAKAAVAETESSVMIIRNKSETKKIIASTEVPSFIKEINTATKADGVKLLIATTPKLENELTTSKIEKGLTTPMMETTTRQEQSSTTQVDTSSAILQSTPEQTTLISKLISYPAVEFSTTETPNQSTDKASSTQISISSSDEVSSTTDRLISESTTPDSKTRIVTGEPVTEANVSTEMISSKSGGVTSSTENFNSKRSTEIEHMETSTTELDPYSEDLHPSRIEPEILET